jgi:hypothetical protein
MTQKVNGNGRNDICMCCNKGGTSSLSGSDVRCMFMFRLSNLVEPAFEKTFSLRDTAARINDILGINLSMPPQPPPQILQMAEKSQEVTSFVTFFCVA